MNTRELRKALEAAGAEGYSIRGHVGPHGLAEGAIYLDKVGGRWVFGSYERGTYTPYRYFDSEDEACRYVYELLTRPRKGPRIMTAEERAAYDERARRALEEINRRWGKTT